VSNLRNRAKTTIEYPFNYSFLRHKCENNDSDLEDGRSRKAREVRVSTAYL